MKLRPLGRFHAWYGKLVNLDKGFMELLQTFGLGLFRKIVDEIADFRKYMRRCDGLLEYFFQSEKQFVILCFVFR